MNKFVSVFFAAALALALTACGDNGKAAADAKAAADKAATAAKEASDKAAAAAKDAGNAPAKADRLVMGITETSLSRKSSICASRLKAIWLG